jgi:hypothetical protein
MYVIWCFQPKSCCFLAQGLNDSPTAPTVDSYTQHLLVQLLLVFRWIASLCRIWPSSIPDAAPLHSLLSSALAAAALLITDLPHMQANTQISLSSLAAPVTAAVLEVAATVLQPLGGLLHQQQMVLSRTSKEPPSLSVPASGLCSKLQGDTVAVLQAMLTVCLD